MKMKGKDLFALIGKLDDRYVAAASYLAEGGEDEIYESPARRRAAAFFQSGWFVAILCAVVSLSVVSAIIWAGQQGPWTPPAMTQDGQLTEEEAETEFLLEHHENVKVETEQETTDDGAHRQKVTLTILNCTNQPYDLVFYVTPYPKYEYHHICNPPRCPACDKNGEGEHGEQTSESGINDGLDIHLHANWACFSDNCRTQIGWYYKISEIQLPSDQHYLPLDDPSSPSFGKKYYYRSFKSIQEAIDFACKMITGPVHTEYVEHEAVKPTCLENGHNGKMICHACDKVFMDLGQHLATGHKLVNNQCSVCGIVAGEGLLFVPYGNGTCYIAGFAEDASDRTQAVIPPYTPNGDRVVAISEGAFAGCDDLICVQIPYTIRRIEANAFTDCPNLPVLYVNMSRGNWRIDVVKIAGWCDESLKLNFGDHWGLLDT
ncbi:MAG: hypothetical protein E7645_05235 [Ruminococcaceae bacterium]|nr:hypothetical protein [Oscillospiraceae bacterium]